MTADTALASAREAWITEQTVQGNLGDRFDNWHGDLAAASLGFNAGWKAAMAQANVEIKLCNEDIDRLIGIVQVYARHLNSCLGNHLCTCGYESALTRAGMGDEP